MGYRFPILVGDRVALAPHLDLWMAGVRFGMVDRVCVTRWNGKRAYVVSLPNGRKPVVMTDEDILGAVNAVPGDPGRTSTEAFGATGSTHEPLCSGRTGGQHSVPYCRNNEGGCALHYPSEFTPVYNQHGEGER